MDKLFRSLAIKKDKVEPTQFQYTRLKIGEIRLLKLELVENKTQLKGKIEHVRLDKCPKYTALSYVWGDSGTTSLLQLDRSQSIQITPSLYSALLAVMKNSTYRKSSLVWADQICINQEDYIEKSQQIIIMGDIYQRADITVSWLGEDNSVEKFATNAFGWIVRMFLFRQQLLGKNPSNGPSVRGRYNISANEELDAEFLRTMTERILWSLINLFERPWFSRLWVVQEVTRSNGAVLMWGEWQLPWIYFSVIWEDMMGTKLLENLAYLMKDRIMKDLPYKEGRLKSNGIIQRLGFMNSSFQNFWMRQQILRKGVIPVPGDHSIAEFSNCLELSVYSDCKVDHDRIFAILGLCVDASDIKPDYAQSAGNLFRDVALHLMTKEKPKHCDCRGGGQCFYVGISIFSRLSLFIQEEDIPSWVPTWKLDDWVGALLEDTIRALDYDSSKSTIAEIYTQADSNNIQVRGKIWDRVVAVGLELDDTDISQSLTYQIYGDKPEDKLRIYHYPIFRYASMAITLREAETLASRSIAYGDDRDRTDALWKTMCANAAQKGVGYFLIPSSRSAEYLNMFETLMVSTEKILDSLKGGDGTQVQEVYTTNIGFNDRFINETAFLKVVTGRRFFVTELGYMGVGHARMKVGDNVSVFSGLRGPMILRGQSDATYKFVGDCYVHGIMNGEVMDTDEFKVQNITIS